MKHNYLKSLFLMLMMCVGMGAWAEEVEASFSMKTAGQSSPVTVNGVTFSWTSTNIVTGTSNGSGFKANSNMTITIPEGKKLTGIEKGNGNTWGSGAQIDVYAGTSSSDTKIATITKDTHTYTISSNNTGTTYYLANTTSKNAWLNTLTIKYDDNGDPTPETPTVTAPTFDVAAGTYPEDKIVKVSNYSSDYLYAYTLDGTDPAIDAELNVTTGTEYDNNEGITITSSCTLKVIAVDGDGNASTITSAAYVINKTIVFASLEELVAADLTSGTNVTVSFENVAIKDIYVTNGGYRNGVYFDIQKGGKDIEIFYQNVPEEWVVGGTLSGTMTCPWTYYERGTTWELAPASNSWDWSKLTYKAPVVTKENAIINISGYKTSLAAGTSDSFSIDYNGDGELKAVSSQPQFATVALDGNTVTVTTVKAGTTTITITASETENFTASETKYTLTVIPTATLPFSFDGGKGDIESKDGMSQSGLGTDYSASPKLKFDSAGDNIVINFNETAKKVTYTIKGNSTSGTYAFDVMESADGIEYTTVHSHTSIPSTSTECTDNLASTSRFVKFVYTTKASGNVALGKISIVAASELDNPELAFEQSTYTFFTNEDMKVVATSAAGSTGTITYALTDGDTDAFLIDETTGDIVCETPGTYTVTATIAEATDFTSGNATCTVKIKEPVVGNSIIVAETDGKYFAMTTSHNSNGYFTHTEIKKVGGKYVVESLDDILFYTNTTEGKTTTIQSTSNAQYVQATAAKNISFTEDEYRWTNDGGVLTAADDAHGTLQYNTSSPRFTTYTSKVGQYATIVNLTDVIVGEVATITLNAACHDEDGKVYGTYSNSSAWVVPANLTVSEISIVDGALYVESYKTSDVVPANTGVMVSATEGGEYNILIETDPETLELAESVLGEDNCLRPSGDEGINADAMAAAATNCTYYRLTMHNGTQIGFAWGAAEGAAFNLAANKAYLAVPKSASVKSLVWFTGEEDAIKNVEEKTFDTVIYDMQGRKVSKAQKGLYIVNGKKYMVK